MAKHLLSDRFVTNITPHGTPRFRPDANGRIDIGDVKVDGLCLRITPRGLKTWSFIYRPAIAENGRCLASLRRRPGPDAPGVSPDPGSGTVVRAVRL